MTQTVALGASLLGSLGLKEGILCLRSLGIHPSPIPADSNGNSKQDKDLRQEALQKGNCLGDGSQVQAASEALKDVERLQTAEG